VLRVRLHSASASAAELIALSPDPNRDDDFRKQSQAGFPYCHLMHDTKNDLPETVRAACVDLLNARLADAIDLQTQCKQAHWNVRGPDFVALHALFDKINTDVEEYVDLIAERIVQLGGIALGTARLAVKRSALPEYGTMGTKGREHVEALSTALSAFAKGTRAAVRAIDQAGDLGGADILTQISRGTDKWLWMVEAHLG
jgi:starvation-inducible DNA-binding protein